MRGKSQVGLAIGGWVLSAAIFAGCYPGTPPTPAAGAPPPGTTTKPPPAATAAETDGSSIDSSQTSLRFTSMNETAQIAHIYKNDSEKKMRRIIESVGGGGGMFDYDADGLLDLAFTGGGYYGPTKTMPGHPSALYRNRGNWKFDEVTAPAGDGFPSTHYSHGIHAADYDNDGFTDFVICGYGGLQLWHNLGDGTFEEAHAAAALHDTLWSACAGWGDFNGDGDLDLYVAHYTDWSLEKNDPLCLSQAPDERETCPPRDFNSLPDALYFSNGDGTFRDVSRAAGLNLDPQTSDGTPQELGKGLGLLVNDFDLDGDQDIYVANDTVNNLLYINRGDGKFDEDGVLRGVATDDEGSPNGSMGVDVGDFNRDGLPDLWVTNYQYESNGLYRNDGEGQFTHVSSRLGVTSVGGEFVGFGTAFVDLDRDGFEDIVIANGHVQFYPIQSPFRQEPIVFLNQGGEQYRRVRFPRDSYFGKSHTGRGLVTGDVDDDGDVDFCFVNNNDPCGLIRNDSADNSQWLRVRLIGTASNRSGIGATLVLNTSQGSMLRLVKGANSFASTCDQRPIWGIPKGCQAQNLTVRWPSGRVQTVESVPLGQEITILEPQ